MLPKPHQSPPDVWLGGIAPSELKRVGRLADGWLPSFVTPADAERGRAVIEQVAVEHERVIDSEHFGVLIPYARSVRYPMRCSEPFGARPDIDPSELVPDGWDALQNTVRRFMDVGTSKFVVLPIVEPPTPDAWRSHLAEAAQPLLPMQT